MKFVVEQKLSALELFNRSEFLTKSGEQKWVYHLISLTVGVIHAENAHPRNREHHNGTEKTSSGRGSLKKRRIPPMLADIVQATLVSCDGIVFDSCESCPVCGGELTGYDMKKKLFAVLMEEDRKKVIQVHVKRFRCRRCRQICLADQPFYPDTRIGSPVVDLCVTLGETMHFPRVSSSLAEMGIVVDRWTGRNYIRKNSHTIPAADMFGIRVPFSIFSLSTLAMGTRDGSGIDAPEVLAACGYPSRKKDPAMLPSQDPVTDSSKM
jgi:hypothetical protein